MKTITTDKKISLYLCLSVALFLPIDYTKFSHSTPKHQAACNTCHKFPSKDWTKISSFPDVTDYPSHDACVSCHRPQFFRGARPPICSVCHSKTSPRDEVRYAFRNPASKLQFAIEFPHDKHQDAIASLRFAHPPQGYNNCAICHGPRTATFKAAPTDHGSCFNCHWKSQEPVAANCNGCHKLAPLRTFLLTYRRGSRSSSSTKAAARRSNTSLSARAVTSTSPNQQPCAGSNPMSRSPPAPSATTRTACGRISTRNSTRSTNTTPSS